ncbi:proline-rich protein 18 [Microcaecilia unicolor]|uniref:Proline-rich protein 18 n=1 Tax=Microcaecilia unicolor TaxID=1415580 RepID=A0A6P7XKW4_9AMPH|nr:proline-rich protein 18 [Microcaecilia unicolor]
MGRMDEKAQPARPVRSTATSLPLVPQPRESRRTYQQPPTPLSSSWTSGPPQRQAAASVSRRAANPVCHTPPPRCPQSQSRARSPVPEPALRFSLTLTPEAALLIQKRRWKKQQLSPGSHPGAPDLGSVLKVSLLNEHHRYDGEEYEEEEAPDRSVLQKCSEWLRGVESAARAGAADRLRVLPHLGSL